MSMSSIIIRNGKQCINDEIELTKSVVRGYNINNITYMIGAEIRPTAHLAILRSKYCLISPEDRDTV